MQKQTFVENVPSKTEAAKNFFKKDITFLVSKN